MKNQIVIVGSGLAGYLLAKELRQLDKISHLTILTKARGDFYSKPLLSTALTKGQSPEDLAMECADVMAEKLNARILIHSTVTHIDAKQKTLTLLDSKASHHVIPYTHLVLACGAKKIMPPLQGDAVLDIQSVNQLEDYIEFRNWLHKKRHIGILGAGFVGCEFSNDLINAGYQVTVIAPENYPLSRLVPKSIGTVLGQALAEKGVKWCLGHCAQSVHRHAEKYRITLDNGEAKEVDGVFSAVGIRPQLGLAESAGIKTRQGIIVNEQLRTSDPHIYALGDCAEVDGHLRQYVAPLLQAARVLAKVLAGVAASLHYPVMPIVIKTPACPVVVVPPFPEMQGEWVCEGSGLDFKAIFYDTDGQIQGFALVGNTTKEKINFVKQMESIVPS